MRLFLSILTIITILLSACSGEDRTALRQADAVMEEHPDSALAILQRINRNSLPHGDLPYYALLMTQAQIKNDIDVSSDSLISKAYAKYGDDWIGDKGIRSNYYMGEILFNQEKNRDAMKYYLSAYEESKRLGNAYWHAKAAERIADLFFFAYNYDEAEKFLIEAARMFGVAKRDLNQKYATATLAVVYMNTYNLDRAKTILDSLYNECLMTHSEDSLLLAYVRSPMIDIMIRKSMPDSIPASDYGLLNDESSNTAIIDNTILLSQLNDNYGTRDIDQEFSRAMSLAETDEDKTLLYYARYKYEKKRKNLPEAIKIADSLIYYHNALTVEILKESILAAQTEYYSEKSELEKARNRYMSIIIILISMIFVLVIFIMLKYYKHKNLKQKQMLESVLDSLKDLTDIVDNSISERNDLIETIKERDEKVGLLENELAAKAKLNEEAISKVNDLQVILNRHNEAMDGLQNTIEELQRKQELSDTTIENLFKEKWITFNLLCDQYFELGNSEKTRGLILKNIEQELKKTNDRKSVEEIERSVNTYMGGIIERVRTQCPFLKEADIRFMTLVFAGYSVRAVCLIANIKYQNYYLRKSRLAKRILDSNAPDRKLFASKLKA